MNTFYITDDLIASHGQRILNYFMDLIVQVILMVIIIFGLTIISLVTQTQGLLNWTQNMGLLQQYLFGAVLTITYYGVTETMFGRSLGKFVSGTIIVMEDGSAPGSDVILKRTFCRLIPFDWISFLGTPSRGWHDSIPDVYVVDKKLFEAEMWRRRQEKKNEALDITTEP